MLRAIRKLIEDKKEFRQMMARVNKLPDGYRTAFHKMQAYMWGSGATNGMDVLHIQYGLIELFEMGAAEGKQVLDITGEDVASFCDELLRGARMYTTDRRDALNRDLLRALRGETPSRD